MQIKTNTHKKHQSLEEKKRKYDFRVTIFGSARKPHAGTKNDDDGNSAG